MVVSDGDKIYQYKIVGLKFEPEWSMSVRSLGRVFSVYFVDLDGDGVFEVVGNRHDPKSGLNSFIVGVKDGKPRYLEDSIEEFLFPVDIKGDGYKQTVWTQRFSREKFFSQGQAEQMAWKNGKLVKDKTIKVHPAFRPMGAVFSNMRGRTLNDAFIILDEAQNTTSEQMKMFLTRLGFNSKMVITGDVTQVDLPASRPSGLIEIQHVLHGIEGIRFVYFDHRDVVRHDLVSAIVRAYDRAKPAQPAPPSLRPTPEPPHHSPPHPSPSHPPLSPHGGEEGFPSPGS